MHAVRTGMNMKKEQMELLEREQANTEITVYEDVTFWPRTCLIVDLVTLGPKKLQNKDKSFSPTVRGK